MKKKGIIRLTLWVVLLAAIMYVSLAGVSFGIREFKPIATQIQENRLGLDLTGGFYAVYEASAEGVEDFESAMASTLSVYRTRLDSKGLTEATVTRQGTNKIRVEIPSSETDPSSISTYLSTPAHIEWRDPENNVIMDGKHVKSASFGYNEGEYIVSFELDDEGTKLFADATAEFIGKQIGIYLDDTLITNPTVNSVISSGSGYITGGGFTADSARELAMQIESGAIPLSLTEIEVRSISATLGADALDQGVLAGVIGFALIAVFMIIIYRVQGAMATIALLYYVVITMFCVLTVPGVQLTLPGIAGVLLSIGMAVDANVVIFERINEELRAGKTVKTAVDNGFKKALSAVFDSNITTLIAAVTLMLFGTGTIKGFAYTLAIGICVSMLTAVLITRSLMRQIVRINPDKKAWFMRERGAAK